MPKKNRPRYHLGGPTAPVICSSYYKQAPPTVNTAPPTVNAAPPTVNTAPPTVNSAPPTVNTAPPTVNTAPPTVNTAPPTVNTAPFSQKANNIHNIVLKKLSSINLK